MEWRDGGKKDTAVSNPRAQSSGADLGLGPVYLIPVCGYYKHRLIDSVNRPVDREFLHCGPPDRDTPRPLPRLQPLLRPRPRPDHNILTSVPRPHSSFFLTSLAFSVRLAITPARKVKSRTRH